MTDLIKRLRDPLDCPTTKSVFDLCREAADALETASTERGVQNDLLEEALRWLHPDAPGWIEDDIRAAVSGSLGPCLVDDTKKGSGQKDQHLSTSEGDSGQSKLPSGNNSAESDNNVSNVTERGDFVQSGQRTDKPCWNCGQYKEICICDTL